MATEQRTKIQKEMEFTDFYRKLYEKGHLEREFKLSDGSKIQRELIFLPTKEEKIGGYIFVKFTISFHEIFNGKKYEWRKADGRYMIKPDDVSYISENWATELVKSQFTLEPWHHQANSLTLSQIYYRFLWESQIKY